MNTPPTHRTDFHPAPSQKKPHPQPRAAHRSDSHHKEPHPRPRAAHRSDSHHKGPRSRLRAALRFDPHHKEPHPDRVPHTGPIRTTRSHTPTACRTPVRFARIVATEGGVGGVELHLSLGSARERWGAHSPGGRRAAWRAARLAGTHEGGSILAGVLDRTKSGFMLDGALPTAPSLLPPGSTGPSRRPGGGIRRFGGPRRGRAGCASTAGWPANRRRSGWGPR